MYPGAVQLIYWLKGYSSVKLGVDKEVDLTKLARRGSLTNSATPPVFVSFCAKKFDINTIK